MNAKIVFDERSAHVRVVTDAVAMDDGIHQRKRAQEKEQQDSVGSDENDPPGEMAREIEALTD